MRLLLIFTLIALSLAQSFCVADRNYTFLGFCATIAPFNNRTRSYASLQATLASNYDTSASQMYFSEVGNRTTIVVKSDACRNAYFDFLCSTLQPCNSGKLVPACYSVCLNYYYECTFDSWLQAEMRCDALAGVDKVFAAKDVTYCEKVSAGLGLTISISIMLVSLVMFL